MANAKWEWGLLFGSMGNDGNENGAMTYFPYFHLIVLKTGELYSFFSNENV